MQDLKLFQFLHVMMSQLLMLLVIYTEAQGL